MSISLRRFSTTTCERDKKNYIGIFSSFAGSYEVKVPKKRAKIIKDENIR